MLYKETFFFKRILYLSGILKIPLWIVWGYGLSVAELAQNVWEGRKQKIQVYQKNIANSIKRKKMQTAELKSRYQITAQLGNL
jgi:hypothetical protein